MKRFREVLALLVMLSGLFAASIFFKGQTAVIIVIYALSILAFVFLKDAGDKTRIAILKTALRLFALLSIYSFLSILVLNRETEFGPHAQDIFLALAIVTIVLSISLSDLPRHKKLISILLFGSIVTIPFIIYFLLYRAIFLNDKGIGTWIKGGGALLIFILGGHKARQLFVNSRKRN